MMERKQFSSENSYLRSPATAGCTVCLDKLSDGEKITRLPCHHYFHRECIKGWLSCNKTCPNCRRVVLVQKKKPMSRGMGHQLVMGHIRVSYVCYRRPRGLWFYQLMELIVALFFNGDR
ncbi:putative transcription factor C2H2 family [Helianthus annuus]|nr:putative transcription factor C2H2 family [Helianthus annuus]